MKTIPATYVPLPVPLHIMDPTTYKCLKIVVALLMADDRNHDALWLTFEGELLPVATGQKFATQMSSGSCGSLYCKVK